MKKTELSLHLGATSPVTGDGQYGAAHIVLGDLGFMARLGKNCGSGQNRSQIFLRQTFASHWLERFTFRRNGHWKA